MCAAAFVAAPAAAALADVHVLALALVAESADPSLSMSHSLLFCSRKEPPPTFDSTSSPTASTREISFDSYLVVHMSVCACVRGVECVWRRGRACACVCLRVDL